MDKLNPKIVQKVRLCKHSFSILWLLPFASFMVGYISFSYFLHKQDLETPCVIGKTLPEAIQLLSGHHLGIRLLQQQEEASLPEGTILDQLPRAGQKIRPNQNVFVTISARQRIILMPDFWGKKYKNVLELVSKNEFEVKEIQLYTSYPQGMCIAQSPGPCQELTNKKITLYFSAGKPTIYVMPNCKGGLLKEVEETLHQFNVTAEVVHAEPVAPDHTCTECKVIDQQPVPGAIVDLSHGLQVQLRVG